MKKISVVFSDEEKVSLETLREFMREQTGFRMSVSELIRGLVIKEAKKISETTNMTQLLSTIWFIIFLRTCPPQRPAV